MSNLFIICLVISILTINIVVNIRILNNIRAANKRRCTCSVDIANIKTIMSKWDKILQKHENILNPIINRKNEYVTLKDYETVTVK